MKKRKHIRDGAYLLRQRIFKELKKIRYTDKRIKSFKIIKSLNKDLIIFAIEDNTKFTLSFDFFIKSKEEIARNGFYGFIKGDNKRKTFYITVDESKEKIRDLVIQIIHEKEIGTQNENDFFDYVNSSIKIVSKDREVSIKGVSRGNVDEDAHYIDGWIIAKKRKKNKKYPLQLKMSESGMQSARSHIYATNRILLVRYNMNKRPKPGKLVKSLEEAVENLKNSNKRTELIL